MALKLISDNPDNINQVALDEFIQHREELKKPMTPLAITKARNILLKHSIAHQQYMVDTAIMSGWKGLYPVEPPKQISCKNTTIDDDLTDRGWAN